MANKLLIYYLKVNSYLNFFKEKYHYIYLYSFVPQNKILYFYIYI